MRYFLLSNSGKVVCAAILFYHHMAYLNRRRSQSVWQADNMPIYFVLKLTQVLIVYAHGRRLCSDWVRHGSTTISYPQCSLTFMRERYLHIFAYVKSAVGIDVVSVHKLFAYRVVSTVSTDIVSSHTKTCRIAYGITR